jgi:hypothetical protein
MNEPKATDPRWYLTKRQKLVATGNFKSDLSLKNEQKVRAEIFLNLRISKLTANSFGH